MLAPDGEPAFARLILGRAAYSTEEEREAETLASLILEQGSAAPSPAPVVGPVTAPSSTAWNRRGAGQPPEPAVLLRAGSCPAATRHSARAPDVTPDGYRTSDRAWPKLSGDVHDDAVMLVVTPPGRSRCMREAQLEEVP
jgi:hypothetical protein